jgi:nucleotide-binding universal stress UspA family protein
MAHPLESFPALSGTGAPAALTDIKIRRRLALPHPASILGTGINDKKGVAMFKHILVPTDGSELSQDTVRRAVSFAKEAGARITAFYAKPEYPVTYYGEGVLIDTTSPEKFAELAETQGQEILGFAANLCQEAGVPCTKLTATSDVPYEAIIEAATNSGCDLIFMASHGRRGFTSLLLGSETQKVLTHSTIPVLVYRSPS